MDFLVKRDVVDDGVDANDAGSSCRRPSASTSARIEHIEPILIRVNERAIVKSQVDPLGIKDISVGEETQPGRG